MHVRAISHRDGLGFRVFCEVGKRQVPTILVGGMSQGVYKVVFGRARDATIEGVLGPCLLGWRG